MPETAALDVWLPHWADEGEAGDAWVDRVGGAPWGLARASWPSCGVCRTPLSFIGQYGSHPARLPSLREGHVLYAFLCTDPETMLGCGLNAGVPGNLQGAHAVVVAHVRERPPGPTFPPAPLAVVPSAGRVAVRWDRGVETVPVDSVAHFIHGFARSRPDWLPGSLEPYDQYASDEERAARQRAAGFGNGKIGGRPVWLQDPSFQWDDTYPERFSYVSQWATSEFSATTGKHVPTTLSSGMLYLIADSMAEALAERLDLYWIGR